MMKFGLYSLQRLHNRAFVFTTIMLLSILSCKQKTSTNVNPKSLLNTSTTYAEGFQISNAQTHKTLTISNPWPKADKTYKYALIPLENLSKTSLNTVNYNGVITTPVQKIVVTSTTHIPSLELLGVEQTLVGFPGAEYISSKKTRARIDNGEIRELGSNEGINTEVLLEIRPDVVVAFGVDGTNKSLELIEKAGIPVIYNGDWVEKTPLGKAEWLKFFGALYNKTEQASEIFKQIEADYNNAKKIAKQAKSKPSILCGAMYKDVWYLPNGTSPEAQFLEDANTNYLWKDTEESGSIALSFETVFEKAKHAEIWLSPSYYTTYEALEKSNSHYTEFDAFQNKKVFTFSNTTGATGGVLYYELGISRPDLILKDMIKICHPELLLDYNTTFFKPL